MPGNTLVINIYQKLGNSDYQCIYIFYDHEKESYGVRGCRYSSNVSHNYNKYSFFCCNKDNMNDFLNFLLNYDGYYGYTAMNLLNYSNLSLYSAMITYDQLNKNEHNRYDNKYIDEAFKSTEKDVILPHEIMGYVYLDKDNLHELRDDVSRLLDVLKNTWD